MTDYTKLVEALRLIGKEQDCNECEAGKWNRDINCCLFEDAADAIEELQQIADHYEQSAKDWWKEAREYKIKSAEGITAEESKELIKRFKSIPCTNIELLQAEVDKYKTAWAVERENRLGVEEPKRGEWIERYDEDDKPFFKRKYVCSACGGWNTYGKSKYCPNCGAKMEVQDGQ